MKEVFLVFMGGGLGSVLRYALAILLNERQGSSWPWGTLAANTLACFILGLIIVLIPERQLDPTHKWLVATGFCGGLSTFSTFGYELSMMRTNIISLALYLAISIVIGLLAIETGMKLGTRI